MSLPDNERFKYGKVNEPAVKFSLIKEIFSTKGQSGKYAYQVFKEAQKDSLFFNYTKEDSDLLRCHKINKIIEELNLNLRESLEYNVIKCELGLTNFKCAVFSSLKQGITQKQDIAKKIKVSKATISKLAKIAKYKFKFIVKKVFYLLSGITYRQIIDACHNSFDKNHKLAKLTLRRLKINQMLTATA